MLRLFGNGLSLLERFEKVNFVTNIADEQPSIPLRLPFRAGFRLTVEVNLDLLDDCLMWVCQQQTHTKIITNVGVEWVRFWWSNLLPASI